MSDWVGLVWIVRPMTFQSRNSFRRVKIYMQVSFKYIQHYRLVGTHKSPLSALLLVMCYKTSWEAMTSVLKLCPIIGFICFSNLLKLCIKLSVPPISIYILSDAQLSPPSFGIFKNVCWYGKLVFVLVLSSRSFRQKKTRNVTFDLISRCDNFNWRDPFTYTTGRAESDWARLGV